MCLSVQSGGPPEGEGEPLGKRKGLCVALERCPHCLQFAVSCVCVSREPVKQGSVPTFHGGLIRGCRGEK